MTCRKIPGPGFGGFLIKAHIAAHPVLALAALLFAAIMLGVIAFAIGVSIYGF